MRWVVLVSLIGCGDSSNETPHTTPVQAQLCTSGSPGDATCPINTIDLALSGSKLTFALQQDASSTFSVISPTIAAGSVGLYVSHPRFEGWPEGDSSPTENPDDPNATTIINLVAAETTILTPTTVGASRVALAYEAIGPRR